MAASVGSAPNQETMMSSRGKKKTTMAKLNREARLRERRSEKLARKEARRDAAANPSQGDMPLTEGDERHLQLPDREPSTAA
jgi:hypothetical protein